MAATGEALLGRYNGSSVISAFNGSEQSPPNVDLLQIMQIGDNEIKASPVIVLNVDYTGAVHNPPVSPTRGTCCGVYFTKLSSGTTAAYFASAFSNLSNLDIIQIGNVGGNISYYLNYQGVATGS